MRHPASGGRLVLLGAGVVMALAIVSRALAVDPPYLAEFPDPERVAADFAKGQDHRDTLAHQVAALNRLYQLAAEMAGERRVRPGPDAFPNKDELALRARIGSVSGPLESEAMATFDPKATGLNTPRAKWNRALQNYQASDELLDQLLQRYFSPQFRESYALVTGYMNDVKEQSAKETLRGSYRLKGRKMPRWLELSDAQRRNTLFFGGAMVVLLIFGFWLQLRPRPSVPADKNKLRDGFEGQRYDWVTGTLQGFSAQMETHEYIDRPAAVTTQWGDGTVTSSTSTGKATVSHKTNVVEEFSIVYEGGQMDISFFHAESGFKSSVVQYFKNSEHHRVTAVWVRGKGGSEPRYVAIKDWTNRRDIDAPIVSRAVHRSSTFLWTAAPALGLGWVVGSSTDVIPFFEGRPRNVLMALAFGAVCFGIRFVIVTLDRKRSERQLQDILVTIGPDDAAPADPKSAPSNAQ